MGEKKFNARRIAALATLTGLALITYLLEGLFPPMFVPGAKMGLSNIFSLLALIVLGPADAAVLVLARTMLGSLFGSFSSVIYSLPAGVVSISVEIVLVYTLYPKISLVAVSVAGATVHNITQNLIYAMVTRSPFVLGYLPYLVLLGIAGGLVVGVACHLIVKKIPINVFARLLSAANRGEKKIESN